MYKRQLHTCALFYFAFPAVSVTIAEKPESLFPYDYVCIANDRDDNFFEHKMCIRDRRWKRVSRSKKENAGYI